MEFLNHQGHGYPKGGFFIKGNHKSPVATIKVQLELGGANFTEVPLVVSAMMNLFFRKGERNIILSSVDLATILILIKFLQM